MSMVYADLEYNILDADNHLDRHPADLWQKRLPEKLRDRGPKVVTAADGTEVWSYDNGKTTRPVVMPDRGPDYNADEYAWPPIRGAAMWDPQLRLHQLEYDGIYAAIIFGVGGIGKGMNAYYAGDREMLIAAQRAYNDWVIEEYCGESNGRLMGVGGLPWTGDVKDAVAEMEHCMKKGHVAINLGAFPSGSPFPSKDDDYFWAAAQDMGVPLTIHVSNNFMENPSGMDKVFGFGAAHKCGVSTINTVDVFLGQGIPERFPKLKIGLIEANIGWITHFLEQTDYYYFTHRIPNGKAHLKMTPSEQFRQCFWTSFMWDPVGVENRHQVGIDRIMWSTDYPHSGGEWPKSRLQMDNLFRNVPRDEVKLMCHDNMATFLGLNDL